MYPTHPLLMLAVGTERRNDMLRDAQTHRLARSASSDRPDRGRRRWPRTGVASSSRVLAWARPRARHA
jgi:hypothetical protein